MSRIICNLLHAPAHRHLLYEHNELYVQLVVNVRILSFVPFTSQIDVIFYSVLRHDDCVIWVAHIWPSIESCSNWKKAHHRNSNTILFVNEMPFLFRMMPQNKGGIARTSKRTREPSALERMEFEYICISIGGCWYGVAWNVLLYLNSSIM